MGKPTKAPPLVCEFVVHLLITRRHMKLDSNARWQPTVISICLFSLPDVNKSASNSTFTTNVLHHKISFTSETILQRLSEEVRGKESDRMSLSQEVKADVRLKALTRLFVLSAHEIYRASPNMLPYEMSNVVRQKFLCAKFQNYDLKATLTQNQ